MGTRHDLHANSPRTMGARTWEIEATGDARPKELFIMGDRRVSYLYLAVDRTLPFMRGKAGLPKTGQSSRRNRRKTQTRCAASCSAAR
jgi:hypothetical protein